MPQAIAYPHLVTDFLREHYGTVRGAEKRLARAGLVRVSWCRGWIGYRIAAWREALRLKARGIGA